MSKILLIGPLFNKKNPSLVGGIVVLFEDLLLQLEKQNIQYKVIDTNKANYSNILVAFISIYLQFLFSFVSFKNISIHGTSRDYIFIAPFITLLSLLFRKNLSIRKFAGSFKDVYNNSNAIYSLLIRFVLKNSKHNFFETKELVNYFKRYNKNTYWFPNVREIEQSEYNKKEYFKRFVFISSVKTTKGINEIINVFTNLGNEYSIDIYGPIQDESLSKEKIEISDNITYKGSLESKYVIKTLNEYDVLLLPTFHPGEGYPGIIIEAFSVGIPVITTNWKSIPEIVTHNKNGLLIEPKNNEQLFEKIVSLNSENYLKLSQGAYFSFEQFSSNIQTTKFLKQIELL